MRVWRIGRTRATRRVERIRWSADKTASVTSHRLTRRSAICQTCRAAASLRGAFPTGWAMINNDVLRSIRYMLDLSDIRVVEITGLADAGFAIDKAQVEAFLRKEGEEGHAECSDRVLAHFLDGLVIHLRGRNDGAPPRPVERRITNNVVLKKLRVAFELKDVDMHKAFDDAGFPLSKPELSALFRLPGHKNFRACGDQILRNFLKGLTLRVRTA